MSDPYKKILDAVAEEAAIHMEDQKDQFVGESPIEDLFNAALFMACHYGLNEVTALLYAANESERHLLMSDQKNRSALILEWQVQLVDWRVDFLVHYFDWNRGRGGECWRALIVECDGHDFHERTKKQAARDRSRDRRMQVLGIPVLRFTGSELWDDPWGCAHQVIEWMQKGL